MANLKIVYENDPMLRKVSRPVTEITPRGDMRQHIGG